MLELRDDAETSSVRGDEYELVLRPDDPLRAELRVRGTMAADLVIAGACDADGLQDELISVAPPQVRRAGGRHHRRDSGAERFVG